MMFCARCGEVMDYMPWVATTKHGYRYVCSPVCRTKLTEDEEREAKHQRSLQVGSWNAA
jgi:hypothetical protein